MRIGKAALMFGQMLSDVRTSCQRSRPHHYFIAYTREATEKRGWPFADGQPLMIICARASLSSRLLGYGVPTGHIQLLFCMF